MSGEPFGPVVVGVDPSPMSTAAVDLAAEEALARVAPLVVVHAVDDVGGAAMRAAHRLVEVAVAQTRAEHPGLAVSGEVVVDDPVTALVARASGASLLVVGGRERRAAVGAGGLATRIGALIEIPFIVYRPLEHPPSVVLPRPVLLGVSGTAGSDAPVEFAFAEAALRGAPLFAVHVWAAPADTAGDRGRDDWAAAIAAHAEAEHVLVAALERWAEKYPEVRVHLAARHSLDVPVALTAASSSSQLAVIGRGKRTGPVFDVLVRRAHCPVAVVPHITM
jgi:hypothetical protein